MRILIFVDGAQDSPLIQRALNTGDLKSVEAAIRGGNHSSAPVRPWGDDESLRTLCHLAEILKLSNPISVHGCLRFTGLVGKRVPFEVYVKGPEVLRSKRASHAFCFSLLKGDEQGGRPMPRAVLMMDGDTAPEPAAIGQMFSCLVNQGLGCVSPVLMPERVNTPALVWQTVRLWGLHGILWAAQSSVGFQHPVCGACAMFSMDALASCMDEYCKMPREESVWDSMRIEMGEDAYFTHLALEKGFKIRYLLHCHVTVFQPGTWLEYLTQQCRWKRSHFGNRLDLLFCRPRAWLGLQAIFWPLEVLESFFIRGEFLGSGWAVLAFTKVTVPPLLDLMGLGSSKHALGGQGRTSVIDFELLVLTVVWAALVLYIVLSAGHPVADRERVHQAAIGISVVMLASQVLLLFAYWKVYLFWSFWAFLLLPVVFTYLIRFPHGLRKSWAGAVLLLAGVAFGGIENLLAPMAGLANADASAMLGWGTRQGAGERAALAKLEVQRIQTERKRARNRLLACWLFSNISIGVTLLLLGMERFGLQCFLAFIATNLAVNLTVGVGYSMWLWLAAPGYRRNEVSADSDCSSDDSSDDSSDEAQIPAAALGA